MYEENTRFSWTGLFIKIIIVIIFILFTVWLLSLSTKNITKGMSDSLNVLTDNIFSQNVDKMKDVGKSYFTTERLPKKVGETKTLSLAKMYDENLILELKDKNGNACSAKNSYVSVEKLETEYQMKVYLECGDESDYVRVIMGCYNYCSTDICEKKESEDAQKLEYEYSRTSGGSWTNWGAWSEWSKTSVTKTNSRDVETKVVKENYTYDKTITDTKYIGLAKCPSMDGYDLVSNKNGVCTYNKTVAETTDPSRCPSTYNGYNLVSQDGFTCHYSKGADVYTEPNKCASTYNGYNLVRQDGFTCYYSKDASSTTEPNKCASTYNDYILVSQDGFTCNYSKDTSTYADPNKCPSTYGDYQLTSQNGFTCNYSKDATVTISASCTEKAGQPIYDRQCYQVIVGTNTTIDCTNYCHQVVQNVYETRCNDVIVGYTPTTRTCTCPNGYTKSGETCKKPGTATTTTTVGCPSGYSKSGSRCVKPGTATTTTTVGCPSGYSKSGNQCVKPGTATTTTTVGCPSGYSKSGNQCVKQGTATTTTTVGCPSGYEKRGNFCVKEVTSVKTANNTCATGERKEDDKCYKDTTRIETVTGTRNVTYYRYRTRSYVGGTIDYKWSTSKNDTSLINAGYKLTGKTRTIGGK